MRRGLLEFAVVAGLLALAAAGAFALHGDAIRAWLGLRPAPGSWTGRAADPRAPAPDPAAPAAR